MRKGSAAEKEIKELRRFEERKSKNNIKKIKVCVYVVYRDGALLSRVKIHKLSLSTFKSKVENAVGVGVTTVHVKLLLWRPRPIYLRFAYKPHNVTFCCFNANNKKRGRGKFCFSSSSFF